MVSCEIPQASQCYLGPKAMGTPKLIVSPESEIEPGGKIIVIRHVNPFHTNSIYLYFHFLSTIPSLSKLSNRFIPVYLADSFMLMQTHIQIIRNVLQTTTQSTEPNLTLKHQAMVTYPSARYFYFMQYSRRLT
jgi:hypothetical protein